MADDVYENPLISRYSSTEMATLWGSQRKFSTWRRLWLYLAESEAELGLPISAEQLDEMRAHLDDVDFQVAAAYEKRFRHDVMAHVHTFGDVAPKARPIIHLGATSCYVTDNTDLILLREALGIVAQRLAACIDHLGRFAMTHKSLACLGYTHLQPAQPTTVGKRASLWAYDLVMDLEEVEHRIATLRSRGVKGTTGTQASFLALFDGDHAKVRQLDTLVSRKMGFEASYAVTGQTYSRKVDHLVLNTLSAVAASCHKIGSDLRLLQASREMEEPFESEQIGSSAMAYKRNPMRAERMCGLARYVMSNAANGADTHATQWMERTLDDSANRRLSLPQAFLAIDSVLLILENVARGLVVYPEVIRARLRNELPFLGTEPLLMAGVRRGGDRQELHELIRKHSLEAAKTVKEGGQNNLLEKLSVEPAFSGVSLDELLDVGRSAEQVDDFVAEYVAPIRVRYEQVKPLGQVLRV